MISYRTMDFQSVDARCARQDVRPTRGNIPSAARLTRSPGPSILSETVVRCASARFHKTCDLPKTAKGRPCTQEDRPPLLVLPTRYATGRCNTLLAAAKHTVDQRQQTGSGKEQRSGDAVRVTGLRSRLRLGESRTSRLSPNRARSSGRSPTLLLSNLTEQQTNQRPAGFPDGSRKINRRLRASCTRRSVNSSRTSCRMKCPALTPMTCEWVIRREFLHHA